jgi:hypothetical protein
MLADTEKLEIIAGWHNEQANKLRKIKHRSPWTKERDRMLIAHHDDTAGFLSRLASDMRIKRDAA